MKPFLSYWLDAKVEEGSIARAHSLFLTELWWSFVAIDSTRSVSVSQGCVPLVGILQPFSTSTRSLVFKPGSFWYNRTLDEADRTQNCAMFNSRPIALQVDSPMMTLLGDRRDPLTVCSGLMTA
jgi:hypothetical protein